jgi:hypothetical protein
MIDLFLFFWQLPQNLLGMLLVKILNPHREYSLGAWYYVFHRRGKFRRIFSGVSLGDYILLPLNGHDLNTVKHERGHQIQSKWLGIFYLLVIGIPSICGNIYDRIAHKHWHTSARAKWYYNLAWEKHADKLGGVTRVWVER